MTTPPPLLPWQAWAPPLDPPVDGGLPLAYAQAIADATWAISPHLCAALQWEAYAAMLPPSPAVAMVSTGAQTVSYVGRGGAPVPVGDYGLALERAAYHRTFIDGMLLTVPLEVAPLTDADLPIGVWWPTDVPPP